MAFILDFSRQPLQNRNMGQCIQNIPYVSTYLSDSLPGILGENIQLIPRKLHKLKFILGLESFVFTSLLWNKIPWMTFSSPL